MELFIWLAAVLVSIFSSLENGVYTSIGASVALLLIRIAHPRGRWLGTVRIHHGDSPQTTQHDGTVGPREVFVPLDDKDGLRDPSIHVVPPPPGVLIYRFEEAFTYPNCSTLADEIIEVVKRSTRPGKPLSFSKPGDRPWNDPGPLNPWLVKAIRPFTFGKAKANMNSQLDMAFQTDLSSDTRPLLRAMIFDFSGVSNVDTTSMQTLVDVRSALDRYADAPVEYHFANILSPWIRRALLAGGFGTGSTRGLVTEIAPVVPNRYDHPTAQEVAIRRIESHARKRRSQDEAIRAGRSEADVETNAAATAEEDEITSSSSPKKERSIEEEGAVVHERPHSGGSSEFGDKITGDSASASSVPILWAQDLTPFFHYELSAALAAATASIRRS